GGSDEIYGGDDADYMVGDDRDPVRAPLSTHGNDYLDGGAGVDQIWGGGRDDELFGEAGNDQLWGDDEPSSVVASAYGQDYLDREEGDDTLVGGAAAKTLRGLSGNDALLRRGVPMVLKLVRAGASFGTKSAVNDRRWAFAA
ncbi:calcium-binding protein, partial [Pseudorivibacter rhizosphaerae]|uniref:calcium-binding protein n=1 Tax=Methylibium rhizosphaerae TaxID=2570323 RepID=UPI00112CCE15